MTEARSRMGDDFAGMDAEAGLIDTNDTAEGRQRNRRTELKVEQ